MIGRLRSSPCPLGGDDAEAGAFRPLSALACRAADRVTTILNFVHQSDLMARLLVSGPPNVPMRRGGARATLRQRTTNRSHVVRRRALETAAKTRAFMSG